MPAASRPALEGLQDDDLWRPHLDSEMRLLWQELKSSNAGELIELVEDCYGLEPWRVVSEEYRAFIFLLAFQHQADAQWASWLDFLGRQLRERRHRLCAAALGIDRPVKRP
jgi:hypothetical protein